MKKKQQSRQSYFRPEIDAMEGYKPGEQPKTLNLLKLNTNENPYPPSPGVLEAYASLDPTRLNLYPDPNADEVRDELAALYGMRRENFICGNGSDDLLNIAIRCFCDDKRPVACLDPSYSLYPTLAKLQGAECRLIRLTEDFNLPDDLPEQAEDANLLILTRPNAPTGNTFPKTIIEEIVRNFNGMVLIDEAYADFASDNCLDFALKHSNAIVARTFSKSRSLAGIRFGFAAAHPDVVAGMMKMKDSYNLSYPTQKLAVAALRDPAYFAECVNKIRLAREMLFIGLMDLGFRVVPSEANFLFASPPDGDAATCFAELRKRNVLVRYFPGETTGAWLRISIGTSVQMVRLWSILSEMYPISEGEPNA